MKHLVESLGSKVKALSRGDKKPKDEEMENKRERHKEIMR